MRRLLLTWSDRGGADSARRRSTVVSNDRGPVMRLIQHAGWRYDEAWVLTSPEGRRPAGGLCSELEAEGIAAQLRELPVRDPSSYRLLFEALRELPTELARERLRRGWQVDVLLSAGTPQAQTIWVLQVQSGVLPARLLQVVREEFVPDPHPHPVIEVDLDIRGFPSIRALSEQVARLRASQSLHAQGLIGEAPVWHELLRRAALVARSELSVLICGETGTGKELVARAIHAGSKRKAGPFVAENCGALSEGVLASELFGHEAGAFSGATSRHRGLFEQAHGGTLFLDEVGELPPRVQASLLRVLQERKLRRVGGEATLPVDVRVLAATHRDLTAAVQAGTFREDLYFRLNGALLQLPPLRERREDIPKLVRAFLNEAGSPLDLSAAALEALEVYPWPGNVRELRSEIARWTVFCDRRVERSDLSPAIQARTRTRPVADPVLSQRGPSATEAPPDSSLPTLMEAVDRAEQGCIREALQRSQGNLSLTARSLGIDRNTLKRKLRKHGLAQSALRFKPPA